MPTQYGPDVDRNGDSTGVLRRESTKHWSCLAVGLAVTAFCVVVAYPVLVAVTRPFALLSSTWLVLIAIALWVLAWMALEVAWDLRPTRRSGE